MIEPVAPRDPAREDKPFARYLTRCGEGIHSFEIKGDDAPWAAGRLKERGCSLASEYGRFFFVRPESTGGGVFAASDLGHLRPCLAGGIATPRVIRQPESELILLGVFPENPLLIESCGG